MNVTAVPGNPIGSDDPGSRTPAQGGPAIEELARDRLGFSVLRPGQLPAVEALAGGRDALAVLPTGGGKSAIYELAGLLGDGPTIVVSPLIALQDDQLAHLRASGLSAIVLNSQQSAGAHAAALLASCDSDTFVFLSPEQLAIQETRETRMPARRRHATRWRQRASRWCCTTRALAGGSGTGR